MCLELPESWSEYFIFLLSFFGGGGGGGIFCPTFFTHVDGGLGLAMPVAKTPSAWAEIIYIILQSTILLLFYCFWYILIYIDIKNCQILPHNLCISWHTCRTTAHYTYYMQCSHCQLCRNSIWQQKFSSIFIYIFILEIVPELWLLSWLSQFFDW